MKEPNKTFVEARRKLMLEYEQGAEIETSQWLSRYPMIRDELLDYWTWLRRTPRLDTLRTVAADPRDFVAKEALHRAVEAISLGAAWLDDAVDVDKNTEISLGRRVAALRATPRPTAGVAKPAFRKAAVYAWVALKIADERGSATRLSAQKVSHLLERALDLHLFEDHKKMRLGPYDSSARYRDAEPIAEKQGWLAIQGTTLMPGASSAKVNEYARRYVRDNRVAQDLVQVLAKLSDAQLETWATVEWVTRDLVAERRRFDAASIRDRLSRTPAWSLKLEKPNFAPSFITQAIESMLRLRIIAALPEPTL